MAALCRPMATEDSPPSLENIAGGDSGPSPSLP